jgi:hypothetical protein
VFWICIAGAAAAVLASPAYLTEIDSLHGILELAAPWTVLPSEPVRSIPTRHTAINIVCCDLSTWRNHVVLPCRDIEGRCFCVHLPSKIRSSEKLEGYFLPDSFILRKKEIISSSMVRGRLLLSGSARLISSLSTS